MAKINLGDKGIYAINLESNIGVQIPGVTSINLNIVNNNKTLEIGGVKRGVIYKPSTITLDFTIFEKNNSILIAQGFTRKNGYNIQSNYQKFIGISFITTNYDTELKKYSYIVHWIPKLQNISTPQNTTTNTDTISNNIQKINLKGETTFINGEAINQITKEFSDLNLARSEAKKIPSI